MTASFDMRVADPLRVAMLAPPWIPVPAPGYGGIEEVVRLLCEGLISRGHRVTLFAAPGSVSSADVRHVLDEPHPDEIGKGLWEIDHVARAFDVIEAEAAGGDPFDVVHDHTPYAALAMAGRLRTPLVHTIHVPCEGAIAGFYEAHGRKGTLVAISESQRLSAPARLRPDIRVIHNPLAVEEWPFRAAGEGPLLWIGRVCEAKGPHRAVRAARAAGVPLVLAGPVQPGNEEFFAREVEPSIDGDAVRYLGEVGGEEKKELFAQARALLVPIRWREPFGMVMAEAMACGTPVIAFAQGAAPEVVRDGETGFLVRNEAGMSAAIGRLGEIDPERCRASVAERFGAEGAVARYEQVYEAAGAVGPAWLEEIRRRHGLVRRFTRTAAAAFPRPVSSLAAGDQPPNRTRV